MQGPSLSGEKLAPGKLDEIALFPAQPTPPATPASPAQRKLSPTLPQSTEERTTFAQTWKEAILPYLGTRLLVFVVGLFATYYIMPRLVPLYSLPYPALRMSFPNALWLMWHHFDSGFYLQIVKYGYAPASSLHHQDNWVFYPLYPLLMNGLGRLLSGNIATYSNATVLIAGVLISNLAGVGMITYLYLLVRWEFNARIAARSVLYLVLFPTAFFFSAIFTESLLLGLCIACIYYTRRHSWWLAGLCGSLAALTRLQGITLVIPLAWEYLRVLSARYAPLPAEMPTLRLERAKIVLSCSLRGLLLAAREPKNWLHALALALIPCGLLAFMVYGQLHINDFFATFHASAWGWRRHIAAPWTLLIYSLRHPVLGQPLNWNFWVLNITTALAGIVVIVWSWRRLPMTYTLYTAVMVLLPLSSSLLNSYGRYALLVFPAFILLAIFTSQNWGKTEHLHNFIIASFAALEAVFMIFFVLGFPTIA